MAAPSHRNLAARCNSSSAARAATASSRQKAGLPPTDERRLLRLLCSSVGPAASATPIVASIQCKRASTALSSLAVEEEAADARVSSCGLGVALAFSAALAATLARSCAAFSRSDATAARSLRSASSCSRSASTTAASRASCTSRHFQYTPGRADAAATSEPSLSIEKSSDGSSMSSMM